MANCILNPQNEKMETKGAVQDAVKDYYGKVLRNTGDIKSKVCRLKPGSIPKYVRDAMALVHEEVSSRYYGCGLVVPEALEGQSVIDLGSGSGRDCYILAKLVGEQGHVTGLDMTDELLEVARQYIDYHTTTYGYSKPNVEFVKGYMENLGEAGIKDSSLDIVISNCVINLCADKKTIFKEAYRVLKEGGELYFGDMYVDRDLPQEVRQHKLLWGEGFGGALYWKELFRLAKEIGFATPRLVRSQALTVPDIFKDVLGDAKYLSVTYRLFKTPGEKEPCDAVYKGTLTGHPNEFKFDHKLIFPTGKAVTVDAEAAAALKTSRFKSHFSFQPASTTPPAPEDSVVDPFATVCEN